jgi:alkylation response protein AidB-like acyl-CoA dehydrogenase
MPATLVANDDNVAGHDDEVSFRAATFPLGTVVLLGPIIGLGRAALNLVREQANTKVPASTKRARQSDSPVFAQRLAATALSLDAAEMHGLRAARDIDSYATRGERLPLLARARIRADSSRTAQLTAQAIDTLVRLYGSSALADGHPLQRLWQDVEVASLHALLLPETSEEVYGKALLGLDNDVVMAI